MHEFQYVHPSEWKPVKQELIGIIQKVQKKVRDDFTFQYRFVGSSERNMITRDRRSNIGFDFDVNIEVNDPEENYSPEEIRTILRTALDIVTNPSGLRIFGYDYAEDSTRVLTIKVKDHQNARIRHSCDFCLVYNCPGGRQQYIRRNKTQNYYSWEFQSKGYDRLPRKIEWIKAHGLWQEVRDLYLELKNANTNPDKHSRTIFAETVNRIWNENR